MAESPAQFPGVRSKANENPVAATGEIVDDKGPLDLPGSMTSVATFRGLETYTRDGRPPTTSRAHGTMTCVVAGDGWLTCDVDANMDFIDGTVSGSLKPTGGQLESAFRYYGWVKVSYRSAETLLIEGKRALRLGGVVVDALWSSTDARADFASDPTEIIFSAD